VKLLQTLIWMPVVPQNFLWIFWIFKIGSGKPVNLFFFGEFWKTRNRWQHSL
jgi:hypothetical protein